MAGGVHHGSLTQRPSRKQRTARVEILSALRAWAA
jgi:hypothetical protein